MGKAGCGMTCWAIVSIVIFCAAPCILIGPLCATTSWATLETADAYAFHGTCNNGEKYPSRWHVNGTASRKEEAGLFEVCRGVPCSSATSCQGDAHHARHLDCNTYTCESHASFFGVLLIIAWILATFATVYSPLFLGCIMTCGTKKYPDTMAAMIALIQSSRSAQGFSPLSDDSIFLRLWVFLQRPYFSIVSWLMLVVGVIGSIVSTAAEGAHMGWCAYAAIGVCTWHGLAMVSHLVHSSRVATQEEAAAMEDSADSYTSYSELA